MRFTPLLLTTVLVLGASSAIASLYDALSFEWISQKLMMGNVSSQRLFAHSKMYETDGILDGMFQRDARIYRGLGKYLYRASRLAATVEERRDVLCEALANVERSLKIDPDHAMTIVAWVELATLLEQTVKGGGIDLNSAHCATLKNTPFAEISHLVASSDEAADVEILNRYSGDQRRALLSKIANDYPWDPQVQYQIGRLAWSLGMPEVAKVAFNRYLVGTPAVSSETADVVEEWILESGEVLATLPAEMPQTTYWSRRLRAHLELSGQLESSPLIPALAEKQRKAIEARWQDVEGGEFPVDLFVSELVDLSPLAASDSVRKEIDATILHVSRTYQNRGSRNRQLLSNSLSSFLSLRAQHGALQVSKGWNYYDLKPDSGMLSMWGTREPTIFDQRYRSVGFMTARAESPVLITLTTPSPLTPDVVSRLRLFYSDDNIHWNELSAALYEADVLSVGENSVLYFHLLERKSSRLWKIHYASKSDTGKIEGNVNAFLAVYGGGA
ncbi:MAG: hypothetical protein KDD70_06015 [Bdellovibrionales bacterium]|nr:hypothetical protein [Bdellovibrionales bacterium]